MESLSKSIINYQLEYEVSKKSVQSRQNDIISYIITKLENLESDIEDFYFNMISGQSQINLTSDQKKELKEHNDMIDAINTAKPLILLHMINKIDLKRDIN